MVNDDNDVDDDDDDIVVDMIIRGNAVKSLSGEESRRWWIIYRMLKNRLKISPELLDGVSALEQSPPLRRSTLRMKNLPPLPLCLHQGCQLRVAFGISTITASQPFPLEDITGKPATILG